MESQDITKYIQRIYIWNYNYMYNNNYIENINMNKEMSLSMYIKYC